MSVRRTGRKAAKCQFSVESLEDRRLLSAVLSVGANVDITRRSGNEVETFTAINPTNPNNIITVSCSDLNHGAQILVNRSTNGGASWSTSTIGSAQDGLSASTPRVDPRCTFDSFGNLYVSYMVSAASNDLRVLVAPSSNGGQSFKSVLTAVSGTNHNPDYPVIAAGVDPTQSNRQDIYVAFTDYTSSRIEVVRATATASGKWQGFSAPVVVSSQFGTYASVAVGPRGQVAVTWQDTDFGGPPTNIYMDSTTNFANGFGMDRWVSQVNVGGWEAVPAQPNRTIFASPQVAFDTSGGSVNGRLYLSYCDAPSAGSADTNIMLRYTDNLGLSISGPVTVNDDHSGNSQFLPNLAVDPKTGNVAISWYDARNSSTNTAVQVYAAVSTDHGATFSPNVLISKGTSNANNAHYNDPLFGVLDLGDYAGLAFYNGKLVATWADNSNSAGVNPNGANNDMDVYSAVINVSTTVSPTKTVSRRRGH